MNKNVEEYLAKTSHRVTNVFDYKITNIKGYNRNVSIYCTSTVVTKVSWETIFVTTRLKNHHEKF